MVENEKTNEEQISAKDTEMEEEPKETIPSEKLDEETIQILLDDRISTGG